MYDVISLIWGYSIVLGYSRGLEGGCYLFVVLYRRLAVHLCVIRNTRWVFLSLSPRPTATEHKSEPATYAENPSLYLPLIITLKAVD